MDRNICHAERLDESGLSPLHGGVDRNICHAERLDEIGLSPLHGGVDRNPIIDKLAGWLLRRPFTGAWIETRDAARHLLFEVVAPSRGRGSKHDVIARSLGVSRSPLHGGVDRNI